MANAMPHTLKSTDWFSADGFPIAIERREPQQPFPRHRHEFSEIVVVTGGKGLHMVGRESWPLAAGDVFVIGGPRTHEYRELENLSLINILFRPEKLRLDLADLAQLPGYHALFALEPVWRRRHQLKSRLRLTPRDLGGVLALVDDLDEELKTRAPGFGFLGTALFMQIVGYLSRCYGRSQNPDSRNLLRIAESITHLEAHTDRPVHLDQLAKLARMSKRSFLRAFRAATGVTPIAYWIQLRINQAAALLRSGSDPITEIAFRVGFTDSNYFTRQFRKLTGLSPRRYRQQHLRDHPESAGKTGFEMLPVMRTRERH
jgi:AraC family L-rhamnose operon transcriptional activator RhaR/AraC family L-rhamnose operon regulatory protein RhaS